MPRLVIPIHNIEQLDHVFKAEKEMIAAGVSFDTGCPIVDGKPTERHWELDYSLSGATIESSEK